MNIREIMQEHASRAILAVGAEENLTAKDVDDCVPVQPLLDRVADLGDYFLFANKGREVVRAFNDTNAPATASYAPMEGFPTLGFVNLRVSDDLLREALIAPDFSSPKVSEPKKILVDFSGPNFAKKMHVGHLRSTLIGDQIARALEMAGHDVSRVNHVGDWGSQFGAVLALLRQDYPEIFENPEKLRELRDWHLLYPTAKGRVAENPEFAADAATETLKLQSEDPGAIAVWEVLCALSREANERIYKYLNVSVEEKGESAYSHKLADVVAELIAKGIAYEDPDKSVWVDFPRRFSTPKYPQPDRVIIRKSDGGYNYLTTDLAAIRDRAAEYDRVLYVADASQRRHFNSVREIANRAGWFPEGFWMKHLPFGVVTGPDGKRLKSRDGNAPDLLIQLKAVETAARAKFSLEEPDAIVATAVGALRFAELSRSPEKDYRFDIDEFLSLSGKTAAYVQYARVRAHAIGCSSPESVGVDEVLGTPFPNAETRALGMKLARFGEKLEEAVEDLKFAPFCDYLYELASQFNRFYETTPVQSEPDPKTRMLLLALCRKTSRCLAAGLAFLGIESPEKL